MRFASFYSGHLFGGRCGASLCIVYPKVLGPGRGTGTGRETHTKGKISLMTLISLILILIL